MIIFTPIKQIPVELLELKGIRQVVSYNLSSLYNEVPTLNFLIPLTHEISEDVLTGDCTTPEFDIVYHNYILNNDSAFIQFMNIIIPIFQSPDVLVQVLINSSILLPFLKYGLI